jgi:hypothetical protein
VSGDFPLLDDGNCTARGSLQTASEFVQINSETGRDDGYTSRESGNRLQQSGWVRALGHDPIVVFDGNRLCDTSSEDLM